MNLSHLNSGCILFGALFHNLIFDGLDFGVMLFSKLLVFIFDLFENALSLEFGDFELS